MTEQKSYKPIGGVLKAELYAVGGLASIEDAVQGGGIEVELKDDGSCYEELFLSDTGLVSVQHTLTLAASRNDAGQWLDVRFREECAAEGVVARVTLSTGESLLIGWSNRFGFEQALRLKQMLFSSGRKPTDEPCVVLTLQSQDTQSAIV